LQIRNIEVALDSRQILASKNGGSESLNSLY
jgi:hypothetical protein